MNGHSTKRFSFRFSNIRSQQAENLEKSWPNAKISTPSDRLKSLSRGGIVGIIPIEKGKKYHWLNNYIKRNRINISQCDVFVSIRTEYDTQMFTLPSYVMKVIHDTGVDITFSFTSITS